MQRWNFWMCRGFLTLGWLTLLGCQPEAKPVTSNSDVNSPPSAVSGDPLGQAPLGTPESKADDTAAAATSQNNPFAQELKILAWNVESEGSDPATIAQQLEEFQDVDIIALSEVLPTDFIRFSSGRQEIHSDTGNNDRLMIAFNPDRFELVRQINLDEINNGRHRSPLVAHLREKVGGFEFLVVNNHLARGNAEFRAEQALGLVEWARNSPIPIVAVGDYNFDYEFATKTGNEGFRAMLRDGIWKWIEPNEILDSNYFDGDGDGQDDYPDSLLDFVFVAGSAMEWPIHCEVIVRDGDFPDDKQTSDHRPILTIIGR